MPAEPGQNQAEQIYFELSKSRLADLLASAISSRSHDGEVVTGALVQAQAVQQPVGQGQVLPQPVGAKCWSGKYGHDIIIDKRERAGGEIARGRDKEKQD